MHEKYVCSVGSPSCGQSEPINDIMYSVMEIIHVGFCKCFSKSIIFRNVLIDIPGQISAWRTDDQKANVVQNGLASKEEFM